MGERSRIGVPVGALHAGMRADELLAEGDGAATWRAIIRAIQELQPATRREGEAVN